MTNKRLLVIGSYPIAQALHGGQKRTRATFEAYKQVFDEVKYVAVFFKDNYQDSSKDDIPVGAATMRKLKRDPTSPDIVSDVICGDAVYDDPEVRQKVTALLDTYRPDIICIEQPYLYSGLKKLLAERDHKPVLIFGSHNIEHEMKKAIFKGQGVDKDIARQTVSKIKKLEEDLSRDAALVVTVSKSDEAAHKKMGAKSTVVAPNGIDRLPIDEQKLTYWRTFRHGNYVVRRKIVFVASAHPPNWFGFDKMVGIRLGFIPSDTRLFLVGGISDYYASILNKREVEDICFWQRAVPCGRPDDAALAALLADADVVILPITEGGGSNLKTAEAILSNKKVVATQYAFRAFEHLQKLPNLYISDDPVTFRANIVKALNVPHKTRTASEQKLAESVLWENCLKDLKKKVESL